MYNSNQKSEIRTISSLLNVFVNLLYNRDNRLELEHVGKRGVYLSVTTSADEYTIDMCSSLIIKVGEKSAANSGRLIIDVIDRKTPGLSEYYKYTLNIEQHNGRVKFYGVFDNILKNTKDYVSFEDESSAILNLLLTIKERSTNLWNSQQS